MRQAVVQNNYKHYAVKTALPIAIKINTHTVHRNQERKMKLGLQSALSLLTLSKILQDMLSDSMCLTC